MFIGQGYFDEWGLTYGKRRDRDRGRRKKNGVLGHFKVVHDNNRNNNNNHDKEKNKT